VRGWNSNWGTVKLMELTPDGQQVKEGAVIARASSSSAATPCSGSTTASSAPRRGHPEPHHERPGAGRAPDGPAPQGAGGAHGGARRAAREGHLPAAGGALQDPERIADFEVEAVTARLAGARRSQAAELAYQDLNVKWVHEDLSRYRWYENAFQLKAPHDGVVRHAFNSRERRKLQKGDACSAGTKVVSLAKDDRLAARFFVPEHRLAEIALGDEVVVTSNTSAEQLRPR
jgi:hypothetical protein